MVGGTRACACACACARACVYVYALAAVAALGCCAVLGAEHGQQHMADGNIGFVIYDIDASRQVPHAILAARSLLTTGGWTGHITVVTTCSSPEMLLEPTHDASFSWYTHEWKNLRSHITFKHVAQGSRSTDALRASHLARVGQTFRLLPAHVDVAIILDQDVFAGDSVSDLIQAVNSALLNLQATPDARDFLLAIPAEVWTWVLEEQKQPSVCYSCGCTCGCSCSCSCGWIQSV